MKTSKLIKILSVALLLFGQGCSSYDGPKPGDPAPFALIYMANGKDTVLSDYKGKTVALIFWASWCNFSKYAMDDFNEKAGQYKDRKDLVFLAVSIDESREEFEERVQVRKYNNIIHAFSGNGPLDETYLRFGSPAIPAVYMIDPEGTIKEIGRRVHIE